MTRIAISGIRGRMGRALLQVAAERSDIDVIGGMASGSDRMGNVPVVALEDAADLIESADAVVDFSSASATRTLLDAHAGILAECALVVGTTGLGDDVTERLRVLSGRAPVLTAANFSLGVNLLLSLTERVAAALDASDYDIEIIEAHHRRKVDAPSGTALALGEAAAKGRGVGLTDVRRDGRSGDTGERPHGEIGFHAVRAGGIVGEHRVVFGGERERVELVHEAFDRSVFAAGALTAAVWLAGRDAGQWTMRDVLGL